MKKQKLSRSSSLQILYNCDLKREIKDTDKNVVAKLSESILIFNK